MIDSDLNRLLALQDGFIVGRTLQLAAELGVADLLVAGPRDVQDLAAATSTNPSALYTLLRTLTGSGVFTEVRPGHFGLTPVGAYLRTDHPLSIRSFLRWGHVIARAFADAEHSLRTGAPAFDIAFGESLFDYLHSHPEHAAIFNTGMSELGAQEDTAVVDIYDFSAARSIVDVGGGRGTLLCANLRAYPEATGVLFDDASVVTGAQEVIDATGLADRCVVAAGDFFHEVSAGGDIYLLKSVIHDWQDAQAVQILTNCGKAMSRNGKLLLLERVAPAGDEPHPSRAMDFAMLVLAGGQERTADQHAALLTEAGFRVTRVIETASAMSVIEAVPNSE